MTQIVRVVLPSGDPVWVRVGTGDGATDGWAASGAEDVGLRDSVSALIEAGQVPGFAEAVKGVVASVRHALEECRPDEVTVEFGLEITAKTGTVLSVLADTGGRAQIRVSASWSWKNGSVSNSPDENGQQR